MTSNANIVTWILSVIGLAVMKAAAAARVLSASPMASPDATTVTSRDILSQWLKITAVPLGVFLMGASIWGCIKNSPVWRSITGPRGHLSDTHARDEVQTAEQANNSRQDGSDLEERTGSPQHHRLGDGPAVSEQTAQTMLQPALQSPHNAANIAATAVAPQLECRAIFPV